MKEQSASGILGTSIEKIKDLVDVSTIIGDPMDLGDGIKIIPVSKVSYGFASGGSDFPSKSNAELFGKRYEEELYRVIVHGILHLCGINDKGPGEREIMEAAEDKALAMLAGMRA